MTTARVPKMAGIDSPLANTAINPAYADGRTDLPGHAPAPSGPNDLPLAAAPRPVLAVQDRLASWVSDLSTLQELVERLTLATTLEAALEELLRAGASLVGARRGLAALEPSDGLGPRTSVGLGLPHADLGAIETVPGGAAALAGEPGADPRHRKVAAQIGFRASYGLRLATRDHDRLGTVIWLYDESAAPAARQRHLVGLYVRYAAEHVARLLELARARTTLAALREELLPSRLPRVPGVRMAVRHRAAPRGGGDWYDALPLPDAALGLTVGTVTGHGPGTVAAMGRLRASLRAYAVMEGEDPVAVLSDLELLLRFTEPARSATALFAYVEPAARRLLLAGAGHCPPLIVGDRRAEYVETGLSAPLGMLSCWEAPSVEIEAEPGETLLLYTDGLPRRMGESVDRSFAMLRAAAASAPRRLRQDPELLADHVLRTCLPEGHEGGNREGGNREGRNREGRNREVEESEDIVLLAVRFD